MKNKLNFLAWRPLQIFRLTIRRLLFLILTVVSLITVVNFSLPNVYADVSSGLIASLPYKKCIDLINNDRTDGNTIQLIDCKPNEAAQKWQYNTTTHRITLLDNPTKCLDLNNNYQNDGEIIKILTCRDNNPAQEWYLTADGQIQLYSNRTVCIDAYANYNGAKVYLHHCHGGQNQRWRIVALQAGASSCTFVPWSGAGNYCSDQSNLISCDANKNLTNKVGCAFGCQTNAPGTNDVCRSGDSFVQNNLEGAAVSSHYNKCIDLINNDRTDHNPIQLMTCKQNEPAQGWYYNFGTKQLQLKNDRSKCLDLDGSGIFNGNKLKILNCRPDNDAQQWFVTKDGQIKSKINQNYCIDASSGDDGAKVYLFQCHGGGNQKWIFKDQTTVGAKCDFTNNAFCGEYYNGLTFPRNPTYTQNTNNIDYNWGQGAPASLSADGFTIIWKGNYYFDTISVYRFTAGADDGIKVTVDGNVVIDAFYDHSYTEFTKDITLSAGYHKVQVDYYEKATDARVKVFWNKVDILTEHFNVRANQKFSFMNMDADTKTYREPNRDVYINFANNLKKSALYDGTSRVWIVTHGWGNDSGTLAGIANEISRKYPNDYVLTPDWRSITYNGNATNQGNDIVAQWIIPTADGIYNKLNQWGLTSVHNSKINFVGHSFGSYVSAEIGNRYKNASRTNNATNKVNSIIALDPAANGSGDSLPSYELNGNTTESERPVEFYKTARFTRGFVAENCLPVKVGSLYMAKTTNEAFIVDYVYHPENDCLNIERRHAQPWLAFERLVRTNNFLGINSLDFQSQFIATRGKGGFDGKITINASANCNVTYSLLNYGNNTNTVIATEANENLCMDVRRAKCRAIPIGMPKYDYCQYMGA